MAQKRLLLLLFSHLIITYGAPELPLHESPNSTNSTKLNDSNQKTSAQLQHTQLDATANSTISQQTTQNISQTKTEQISEPTANTEIDWTISYQLSSNINTYNTSITHYHVRFHSFHCKNIDCECQHIDMQIVIASIRRTSKPLSCNAELQMTMLPGVVYKFHIAPKLNDTQTIIAQRKTFFISQDLEPDLLFFGLQLQLDHQLYASLGMDTKQVSNKLVHELSELCTMELDHISVTVDPPSSVHHLNNTQVRFIVSKMEHSTESQVALEKARNLIYDPDESLMSTIVQNSASMQLFAITLHDESIHVKSNSNPSPFNYGSVFAVIAVMLACVLLMAKYAPSKFKHLVDFCKMLSVVLMEHCRWLMNKASTVSFVSHGASRSTAHQYDVLNISEDLDGEMNDDESGIVLLNQVFQQQNVALFTREKYIQILKDNWLTTTEQLKQLNKQDWIRFGIPQNIQNAILTKLLGHDDSVSDLSQDLSYSVAQSLPDVHDVDPTIAQGESGDPSLSDTEFSDF